MKKFYGIAFMAILSAGTAKAQLSEGGLPLSQVSQSEIIEPQTLRYPLPDWDAALANSSRDFNAPYLVALFTQTDLSFPQSGSFTYNDDGSKIWTAKISVSGAKALGLYADKFFLPEGVKMFVTNENKKQVLGAYTTKNNGRYGKFAIEAVQGSAATIELDINSAADVQEIQLHINKAATYFRSVSYLKKFLTDGTAQRPTEDDPFNLEGSSSTCQINAICPEGANYSIQRKSTLQALIPVIVDGSIVGLTSCSATLINNTGNTLADCKQYVLLATHCDGANSTEDENFEEWMFRFNFENEACTGGPDAEVNTLTGASFRARANYEEGETVAIDGDFLLLELNDAVPVSWDAYMSGWNRNAATDLTTSLPKKFIGFHHAAADVKKLMTSQRIYPDGEAGGTLGAGTHWFIYPIAEGGIEGGSSGSGLFDPNGRLIGIASVAGAPDATCNENDFGNEVDFFQYVAYSKLSLAWDYELDGDADYRRLQPWLDPAGTGAITIDPLRSDCSAAATNIIDVKANELDNAISLYPNPVSNGTLHAVFNLNNKSDIVVEVYNIAGAKQSSYLLKDVVKGSYNFDLSNLANGMYLVKFSGAGASTGKKIMLAK